MSKTNIHAKYVDDVSTAMWREMAKNACIRMLLAKLKKNNIKLEDNEKKLLRQAMFGPKE